MKEERKMRADDDGEALSEVPVPGVRAIEVSHTVEDVKLEEVELNQGPLKTQTATLLYSATVSAFSNLHMLNASPFHRIYSRSQLKSPKPHL